MKHFVTVDTNPLPKHTVLKILATRVARSDQNEMLPPEILETLYTASRHLESTEQKHQPEAALSLLSEFLDVIYQKRDTNQPVQSLLEQFLEERLKIPFGALTNTERQILKNLEDALHQRIIAQDEAIDEIAGALRRRQLKLSAENKPIGTFLFLGPTGVGKTETAKALAHIFFDPSGDGEKNLIRFDMSRYQHEAQIEELIEELAQAIRETPYAVLLLDELEKANRSILNLFLTIIDEGYFTDNNRSTVLCSNLIIIGTSNAASEFIREHLANDADHGNHAGTFNSQVIEHTLKQGIFSPEFINRFDAVVVYTPLTRSDLKEIAHMKLTNLKKRLQTVHHKTFTIPESMLDHIVEEGTHPEFGARELDRAIRRLVEEPLAEKLLSTS